MNFIASLDEEMVKSASEKAFESLPDIGKAITALTVLKGIGPATASAVLAAYAPEVAPFMSDEVKSEESLFMTDQIFRSDVYMWILCCW